MNASYAPQAAEYQVPPSPQPRHAVDDLTLAAIHTAINISGLFVKCTVRRWDMPHLEDTAARLAVELNSRAVETTGIPQPRPSGVAIKGLHLIRIRIHHKARSLLIEIWDSDPAPPRPTREPAYSAYLDAYLLAVEEMSTRWVCYRPPSDGKIIWAELTSSQPQPPAPSPQRAALYSSYPTVDEPVTTLQDVPLMQRVRDGLHRLDAKEPE